MLSPVSLSIKDQLVKKMCLASTEKGQFVITGHGLDIRMNVLGFSWSQCTPDLGHCLASVCVSEVHWRSFIKAYFSVI